MAKKSTVKEAIAEFKARNRKHIERSKVAGKILMGAGLGGAVHGGIRAKTRGKTLGSNIGYEQVATAGAVVMSLRDEKFLGPAAGMVGATSSRAVEDAIVRAEQNQQQGAAPPAQLPFAAPPGALPQGAVPRQNVVNIPAAFARR